MMGNVKLLAGLSGSYVSSSWCRKSGLTIFDYGTCFQTVYTEPTENVAMQEVCQSVGVLEILGTYCKIKVVPPMVALLQISAQTCRLAHVVQFESFYNCIVYCCCLSNPYFQKVQQAKFCLLNFSYLTNVIGISTRCYAE